MIPKPQRNVARKAVDEYQAQALDRDSEEAEKNGGKRKIEK